MGKLDNNDNDYFLNDESLSLENYFYARIKWS